MKTLYTDIETSPNLADVWKLWKENIPLDRLREAGHIMGFAYKWKDGKKAKWIGEDTHDYVDMLQVAHDLLSEADEVVTYNGDKFDIKYLNGEFISYGFVPPAPYQSTDLYKIVKKHSYFPSKKLEFVANRLLGDAKVKHGGYQMWKDCLDWDVDPKTKAKAWKDMAKYCKKDVELLEPLHDILLPWTSNAINRMLYDCPGEHGCPKCTSPNLEKRGFSRTQSQTYQRYQCKDCGAWSRARKAIKV